VNAEAGFFSQSSAAKRRSPMGFGATTGATSSPTGIWSTAPFHSAVAWFTY
jgi:hypothetical protein